jgi:maleylpyruvate isomerase
MSDLDADPAAAIELCDTSHARLAQTLAGLTDTAARAPSRLGEWTVAHVVTHIARNADGHVRRLDGALEGLDVNRYPGGSTQRGREIAEGAERSAAELVADLAGAQQRLEEAWRRSAAAGWPHAELLADDHWPTTSSPVRRLREVEVHHVDLGLGYEPADWPAAYVAWELPTILATVPKRLRRPDDARDVVTWLTGRGPMPAEIDLDPC